MSAESLTPGPLRRGSGQASPDARERGRALRVGTRGSQLALRQTEIALEALRKARPEAGFEILTIRTTGDRSKGSLSEIGGRGVFVVEIERALLAGEIDIAVHSLKDLPTDETPGLAIAAVLPREDPRDALVSRRGARINELEDEALVGTGSPRRAAQLLAMRPDLRITDIRGNVDTRMAKVESGDYDAVVLAAAGLARLDCLDRAAQVFDPDEMLPAPGQGTLAVQVRTDDAEAFAIALAVDDVETRAAITAERAFERRLGGGCHAAIAALGVIVEERLRLRGLVADPEGGDMFSGQIDSGLTDPESAGLLLAEQLIERGAGALLEAAS